MKALNLHSWDITPKEAIEIQRNLAKRVVKENHFKSINTVAGVDISVKNDTARAAVVILSFPELKPIEEQVEEKPLRLAYIPGLLSFRESPSILACFEKIKVEPDLIMADGQGIAHPRRFGIATHLGLLLNKPAVGVAKSLLCGKHDEPAEKAGNYTKLCDGDEILGAALRTKDNTNVVYVSIGHKIDLESAIFYTIKCCKGYRLPEPTRLADKVAGGTSIFKSLSQQGKLF